MPTTSDILNDALELLSCTQPEDASVEARGLRAHARVLAMVEMAREAARTRREQRIANLLLLAQLDKKDSGRALKEARRLLFDDGDPATGKLRTVDGVA
ncbi:hypothetical protein JTF08_11450 [Micrococcaceae bacterium RIT802]|nr:hypothetical protein [Micrococcaceae bacterium RIT 802]